MSHVNVGRTYLVRDIYEEMQLNGIAPDRRFFEYAIRYVACVSLSPLPPPPPPPPPTQQMTWWMLILWAAIAQV